jgi:hypothetical protein
VQVRVQERAHKRALEREQYGERLMEGMKEREKREQCLVPFSYQ